MQITKFFSIFAQNIPVPYFRITILLKNGKQYRGVRLLNTWSPDTAYRMVEKKAMDYFGENNVKKLEVVMLPKNSEEVKLYIKNSNS